MMNQEICEEMVVVRYHVLSQHVLGENEETVKVFSTCSRFELD
jgi:hypothetical protein